jgi:prevent-host-death family protein
MILMRPWKTSKRIEKKDITMSTVTIEEAQTRLTELIDKLALGEEVLITRNQRPVAKLVGQQHITRKPRQPGNCKGMLTIIADDDEHLADFKDYMP